MNRQQWGVYCEIVTDVGGCMQQHCRRPFVAASSDLTNGGLARRQWLSFLARLLKLVSAINAGPVKRSLRSTPAKQGEFFTPPADVHHTQRSPSYRLDIKFMQDITCMQILSHRCLRVQDPGVHSSWPLCP